MNLLAPGSQAARQQPAHADPLLHRRRQEWLGLGLVLLLVGAAMGWLLYSERRQITVSELDRLQAQVRVIDDNMIRQLEGVNKALESVRDEFLLSPRTGGHVALSARLKVLSDVMLGVRTLAVLDAEGTIVASSREELLAKNYAQRPYFDRPRRQPDPATLYVSPPFRTVLGTHTIFIGRALIHADGRFAGVVVATLDPDYFSVLLRSVVYAPDMQASITHPEGGLLLRVPADAPAPGPDPAGTAHARSDPLPDAGAGTSAERMAVERTVTHTLLPMDRPLLVSATRQWSALYRPWRQQALESSGLVALLAALACAGLHLIQRRRQAFDRLAAAAADGLKSARHDLVTSLDAVPSLMGYWDGNLVNRFANRAHSDWFAIDPAALPGTHLRDLLGPALFDRFLPHCQAALRGQAQTFEQSLRRPDGSGSRHTLIHLVPDLVDGQVRGFYALVHDVSELVESRQQLAAALRDNDALLRTIHTHAIVSVTDSAGRIIDVNDNFCRISGYARDELVGQTHGIVNSGVHGHAFWVEMWRTISAGQPWRGEICNRAKDGALYWVDSLIAPFVGANGAVEKYISIRTDITVTKRTEQRLRASEAFLDRAGRIAGVGGWEFDLRTRDLFWSDQTYRIHEIDPGQAPRLEDALNFYAPEARPAIERALADAITHGQGWDLELPFVTARDRAIWVRTVGIVEVEDGQAVRLVGTFQDITSRRQIQAALSITNERFAIAADAAAIGVWEFDVPGNTLVWDDWMYRLYGTTAQAAAEPYALWVDSLHPDDRERCEGLIALALAGDREFETEFRIVRADGEVRTLRAASRTVHAADGTALRMTGVNFDITELKRTEVQLRETFSKLRSVLDAASEVSIIATDKDLNIQLFNRGAERLLGYASDELVGRATPMLIHDADEVRQVGEELTARLGRRIEGAAVFTEPATLKCAREWTYLRKDGSRVQVSLVVTAVHADDGALLGYLGVAHDVTQHKRLEESLRHATDKAEQASRAKSEFLANMSHEIRTPLNAVIGLSHVLRRMGLDAEQAACVAKIELAGKSLLAVINDVLDLSKVEAGALVVEQAVFNPHDLLRDLAAVMAAQATAKGIAFAVDTAPDLPIALVGDARRLNQILLNLVSNAIKFTDDGQVCLRVSQRAVATDRVSLSFVVQDTGIGIAPDVQSRLFAPFVQADASITRRFGGTGLGLSIVRRLARLLGGEVDVKSALGAGSEFTVVLEFALAGPQAAARNAAGVPVGPDALRGVRVLVVDDSPINREVARRILELNGAQVDLAADGQQAVDRLQQRPDAFDVVLMDVQMPVLDGLEATRQIRAAPGLAGLAIIALTAGTLSSEHARATAAGMDDFITKPFEVEVLVATILHHVRPVRPVRIALAAASDAAAPAPPAPPSSAAADDAASPRPPTPGWPEIPGIDQAGAQSRLVGDRSLFLSLLEQLLDEFDDLEVPAPDDGAAVLDRHAQRLHRLGGGAGMLGAASVRELAGAAEAASVAGDAAQAAAVTRRLRDALQTLRQDTAAVLQAARAQAEDSPAEAPPALQPEQLAGLIELLRGKSLSALKRFSELSSALRGALGVAAHDRVRDGVERLQFNEAVTALLESDAWRLASLGTRGDGTSAHSTATARGLLALPDRTAPLALPGPAAGAAVAAVAAGAPGAPGAVSIEPLRSVVYVSCATRHLSPPQLESLLATARALNRQNGVTGLLLYNDGNFMQCFEGPEAAIAGTYARIRASRHHHGVTELVNEPIEQRSFQDWDMALAQPTASELLTLSTARWTACADALAPAATTATGWALLQEFWRSARA